MPENEDAKNAQVHIFVKMQRKPRVEAMQKG